ncbi:hypothetical protein ACX8YQ_005629, partial [Escherichia coli]
LCLMHHSFWNPEYYSISQGAIFADVMKACRQAGRIGNDPVRENVDSDTGAELPGNRHHMTAILHGSLRRAFLLEKTASP